MIDMIMHYLCIQCGVSWLFQNKWLGSTGKLKGSNPSTYARLSLRSNQDSITNQSGIGIWIIVIHKPEKLDRLVIVTPPSNRYSIVTRADTRMKSTLKQSSTSNMNYSWPVIPKRYHFLANIGFFWLAVSGSTKFGSLRPSSLGARSMPQSSFSELSRAKSRHNTQVDEGGTTGRASQFVTVRVSGSFHPINYTLIYPLIW